MLKVFWYFSPSKCKVYCEGAVNCDQSWKRSLGEEHLSSLCKALGSETQQHKRIKMIYFECLI